MKNWGNSGYMACCEVSHKKDGPKTPTATNGPAGLKYQPQEKATTTADFSEIQFTPHYLCDKNHTQRVEA
jgi:hypothetical protein